ncbi:MAG: hypothetical protein KAI28_10885, partial [Sphingomonadales bacterium]|nr:hypothetical protein [Sphingomonadales bacterium]
MTIFNRKHTLLASSALVAAGFMMNFSTPAMAACTPDSVSNGGEVNCESVDTDGFYSTSSNLLVTVLPEAVVNGNSIFNSLIGIYIGDGSEVLVDGTIDITTLATNT